MTTLANSTLSFLIIWMSCGAAFVLATHKLCGSALVDALAVVCNGRGYYGGTVWRTKREVTEQEKPMDGISPMQPYRSPTSCSVKCYKLIQKGADEGKIKPLPETLSDQTGLPSLMQNVTEEQIKWKGVVQDDQRKFNASTWQKYDDEDDRLPESKLNLLDSSDEIKNLLANPHLRQMLSYMDSAKDKEQCIEKAMQEPIFVEFADACLKLVESDSDEEKPPQPKEGFIEVKEFELIQF